MNRPQPAPRGFTLIEMLLVLVLLSLLVLAMASALRTASQTEERIDTRLEHMDDLRVASTFLRSVLGQVSAQKTSLPVPAGKSPYFFIGTPASVTWVGVMPARYGAGGRTHWRLSLNDQGALVLQYLPWIDAATVPDWNAAESNTLLTGVTRLALRYEDARSEPPVWTPEWSAIDRLPDRIAIEVETATGAWPPIAVALRILPASDPSSGSFSLGGAAK